MTRWVLAALAIFSAGGSAVGETLGDYRHGTLRNGDEKLIVCYDSHSALEIAEAVNAEMLDLFPSLVEVSDAERQAIYEAELYPSEGWQMLLVAIRDLRCDLVDIARHTSRRTLLVGPEELAPLGASHSVVQSDFLIGISSATIQGWILTTETVPAP